MQTNLRNFSCTIICVRWEAASSCTQLLFSVSILFMFWSTTYLTSMQHSGIRHSKNVRAKTRLFLTTATAIDATRP